MVYKQGLEECTTVMILFLYHLRTYHKCRSSGGVDGNRSMVMHIIQSIPNAPPPPQALLLKGRRSLHYRHHGRASRHGHQGAARGWHTLGLRLEFLWTSFE